MGKPRLVLVHRRTELDELLERHATRGQAEFFLGLRGRSLSEVEEQHDVIRAALQQVREALPLAWRLAQIERSDLSRFLWEPDDVIAVVGQDGLVANTAKYLAGQPVIGVNPLPGVNAGSLVRHSPDEAVRLIGAAAEASASALRSEELTMVRARLDDGQELCALNEVFVGHASHQSARYTVATPDGGSELQSSSGLIISSGTGSTGWCASIARDRGGRRLPLPTERRLAWFVREAWPSPATGTALTEGVLTRGEELRITVMSGQLVVFGDGIEADRLDAGWGQEIAVGLADRPLLLVA
ncbi:hypothetical protein [Sinomonas mesophila]|uniref:hypothetical protein n=1 Tax=Sinomonas mesophila TaxID=1531955 RepID=UPI0009870E1C|nr:hypothetical protein [Sinomonas mesophila]